MTRDVVHTFKSFPESKREQIIQEGVDLLHRQKKPNVSTVKCLLDAKYKTRVCLNTIRNRASGEHQSARKAHEAQQLLSPVQENVLVDWAMLLSDTGHCINKRTLRKKAEYLCGHKPGPTWIIHFLSRHPKIDLGKPSGLDPKRAHAFNKPTVARHFDLLEEIIRKHDIPPENIYNMDEKGVQRGGGRKAQAQKYIIPRNKRPKYKLRSANLELVTIVECVAANGESISPGIIFEGKQQYERAWFEVDPMISIGLSENGWTSDFHCMEWFKSNFIPQAKARNTSGKYILLIYDGHGSHERLELLRIATENNIILFCLPPHTTHKLQPLDVGVFGPFARAWIELCDDYVDEYLEEMPRSQFVKYYMHVRQKSFKETTIRAAFRKSGIWPFNSKIFTDTDFAPSIDTSTATRNVPDSFAIHADDWPTHQSCSDDDTNPPNADNEHDEYDSGTENQQIHPASQPTLRQHSSLSTFSEITAIPPARFYSNVPKPVKRGRDTRAYISALEKENSILRQENEELSAHATLAFDQIRGLKHRLNSKLSRSKQRKLNTDARWLNSESGLAQCEMQEAEALAEMARKQAKADERQAEERERQRRREQRDPNEPFVGAMNGQRKADLQDIAYSLGLDIDGKVEDLKSRINAFFDQHEELRTSPRYIGLFPQLARQTRSALNNSFPNTQSAIIQTYNQHYTIEANNRQPNYPRWCTSLAPGYIAHIPPYYNVNNIDPSIQ